MVTEGVLGFGMLAQSVGGGGGAAGLAGTVAGSLHSLSVGVGGSGGAQGAGGTATAVNDGSITISGKHGIGLFAQSIGGGGGLVRTMTTDQTFDPAKILNNPQGRLGDVHGLTLSFGGGSNTRGDGGAVQVNASGGIGRTAHGIFAQSVGGGGGLAGDLGAVTSALSSVGSGVIVPGTGSGADVDVALTGTTITTTGKAAPAVFAQSVGGGGGVLGYGDQLLVGSAGGSGGSGQVSVALKGSTINATGLNSPGIMVQIKGAGSTGAAVIDIDASSSVTGGSIDLLNSAPSLAGAIYILDGIGNSITNAGSISGIGGEQLSIAINAQGNQTTLNNSGTVSGYIITGGTGNVVNNLEGGVLDPRGVIALGVGGRLNNAGLIHVGGAGSIGTTRLTGDLVQTSTGVLRVGVDAANGRSDLLAIEGAAVLDGTVAVDVVSFRKGVTAPVITATGGLTGGNTVQGLRTEVFN